MIFYYHIINQHVLTFAIFPYLCRKLEKIMNKKFFIFLFVLLLPTVLSGRTYRMSDYGIRPGSRNLPSKISKAMEKIRSISAGEDTVIMQFLPGRYDFHAEDALVRTYYISNHDQTDTKAVGIAVEDWKGLVIDGSGADFIFHGVMVPIAVTGSSDCTLRNFSVDFDNPQIAQVRILENRGDSGILFRPEEWVRYRISRDTVLETYGEGWTLRPSTGIAFEAGTRHILYNTGDIFYNTKGIRETAEGLLAPLWKDSRLTPGTTVAMRTWKRPAPGIFLYGNRNTSVRNVKVHYAFGMGLIAQLCDGITLDGFGVCLRGEDDPRYFTTQADATHFSQCKGVITSVNGLYEGMMDDAINIHGIYLRVISIENDRTIVGRFMHDQAWGFRWGCAGDSVQFILSRTMETAGKPNRIADIMHGAREVRIVLENPHGLDASAGELGIENITWTPEVYFAGNTVRNNRARGALFSSPKRTVVENNIFDHTSGTAILLCGDCNGWYESGPCRDVLITGNTFINALTSMYQFTNAVISIYPEIPDLAGQKQYFHGGKPGAITVTGNTFETFDSPILYAKSVDGLVFKDNRIIRNREYPPFHRIRTRFLLEKVHRAEID